MRQWVTSVELDEIIRKIYEPYKEAKKYCYAKEVWKKRHFAANDKESYAEVFERIFGETLDGYRERIRRENTNR